jgi:hypothetical protein
VYGVHAERRAWTISPDHVRTIRIMNAIGLVITGLILALAAAVAYKLDIWSAIPILAFGAWMAWMCVRQRNWIRSAAVGDIRIEIADGALRLPGGLMFELGEIHAVSVRNDLYGRPMDAILVVGRRSWKSSLGKTVRVGLKQFSGGESFPEVLGAVIEDQRSVTSPTTSSSPGRR